jgi:hypothetical protein
MKDMVIQWMQWAQDRAQASRQTSLDEEQERRKRKKGVMITCMQWALRGVGVYWQASPDEVQKYEERGRRQRKWNRRITLAIAIAMIGLYLFAISPLGHHSSTTQQKNTMTTEARAYAALKAVLQPYNKVVTLRSSASAALTAFPAATGSNALSSATIDEQTGNQSYTRGMGKGDETVVGPPPAPSHSNSANGSSSEISSDSGDGCNGIDISGSGNGRSGDFNIPKCPNYNPDPNDFMTGKNGIVITFPAALTTDNKVVQTALGAVQDIAFACIVPLLALIGLNVMSGAITMRFANGIEALSRLIPAVIGIAFSGELVKFVFSLEAALTQLMAGVFGSPDLSSVIPPSSSWFGTLLLFLSLGIGIVIAMSFAPLSVEVLGNGGAFGPFIALGAETGIYAAMQSEIPHLILILFAMALCVQCLMRVVLVNFYIILSPLAIAAAVLPGQDGVGFTREWITGLLSLIASQFAQVLVLCLGLALLASGVRQQGDDLGTALGNGLIAELVKYGTITLMMRVPSLFRSNAAGMLSQVGSSAVSVVTGPYLALM